jgi:hypothetical protein
MPAVDFSGVLPSVEPVLMESFLDAAQTRLV